MIKTYKFNPHLTTLGELYNKFTPIQTFVNLNKIGESLIIENGQITGIVVEKVEPIKRHLNLIYGKTRTDEDFHLFIQTQAIDEALDINSLYPNITLEKTPHTNQFTRMSVTSEQEKQIDEYYDKLEETFNRR